MIAFVVVLEEWQLVDINSSIFLEKYFTCLVFFMENPYKRYQLFKSMPPFFYGRDNILHF